MSAIDDRVKAAFDQVKAAAATEHDEVMAAISAKVEEVQTTLQSQIDELKAQLVNGTLDESALDALRDQTVTEIQSIVP